MTAMMNVFIVADLRVIKSYFFLKIMLYIYVYTYYKSTVTFLQLTSTCLDLACLRYDAAMTMRNRRCLQAWIHIEDFLGMCMGRFLKGKHGNTWKKLTICTSC